MNPIRKFLAAFSLTHGLLSACLAQTIPGELVVTQPTPAAPCVCAQGGECQCGENCDCQPTEKAEPVSVLRDLRVGGEFAPITLAPDPDLIDLVADRPRLTNREADLALRRFRERHAHLKEYSGETNKAASAVTSPQTQRVPTAAPSTAPPPSAPRMRRVYTGTVCVGGVCTPQYHYEPMPQPTATIQRQRVTQRVVQPLRRLPRLRRW